MSNGWNFADVWETIADELPDAPAQANGDQRTTWRQFDERANGVAAYLLAQGLQHQDKVTQYMRNRPEYMESFFACCKAGLAPFNTNYRYADDELIYLWDNADAVAVIFAGEFGETCARVRDRLPRINTWLWVDDGVGACPDWATPYETAVATTIERVTAPWGRSGDDLIMLYTGGTTGMPKGVMWRQDDLLLALAATSKVQLSDEVDLGQIRARCVKPGPRHMPAAPLMHGTGLFSAVTHLVIGGSVITMPGSNFDPKAMLDIVQAHRINSISIVGDAFAKPILNALDAEPDRWDISSLRVITSSGVMFSADTKAGLLRHNARLILVDTLGSSEAIGLAGSTTTADSTSATATFALGANSRVLTEDGREVVPGSGERGRVAVRGRNPVGYYKDEAKTAATFQLVDGVRWSIPGDWAEVDADGTVRLLGRGSGCINTGGEKVYPEEVEEVLKLHAAVADAAVIGLPDDRFGQAITAIVQLVPGSAPDSAELIAHVREHLAAYKAPKRVVVVDDLLRANNGKLNYAALTELAADRVA